MTTACHPTMQTRRIYAFSKEGSEGTRTMKELLGGKGANLCEMGRCHLNVPPGGSLVFVERRRPVPSAFPARILSRNHRSGHTPAGFTITTEVCEQFVRGGGRELPAGLWDDVQAALQDVEAAAGLRFGDPADPLLVSVRSGAAVSMPGMMDSVLNLGLNDASVGGLAAKRGERFAYDCYRRLLDMFGDVVLGIPHRGGCN